MAPPRRHILDRMADKFTVTDGCWLWHGALDLDGYGQITSGGRRGTSLRAHRVLYEAMVGPIPRGLTIDHLCRVRNCVRPDHLEPVTIAENVRRGERHNTKKTHCPHGHPYDDENAIFDASVGGRRCRTCRATEHRRAYFRKKAAA